MHASTRSTRTLWWAAGLLALMSLSVGAPAQAQDFPSILGESQFVYEFAAPGQQTMTVYIWGDVGRPGIWLVEPDVDLIALLSAALVPGIGQEQPEYTQHVELSVYRGPSGQQQQVYHARLEDLVAEGADYPTLRDGDILEVTTDQSRRFSFRAIAQYVGTISSLVILFLRLRELN